MPNNPGYHPKELGYDVTNTHGKIEYRTGLFGAILLLGCVLLGVMVLIAATPFLLLGTHEIVFVSPTHWRVRVIRRENDA